MLLRYKLSRFPRFFVNFNKQSRKESQITKANLGMMKSTFLDLNENHAFLACPHPYILPVMLKMLGLLPDPAIWEKYPTGLHTHLILIPVLNGIRATRESKLWN